MSFTRALMPAALLLALACGGSDPYGPGNGIACTPAATRVCMTNSRFNPATLTVPTGTAVTWQNGDGIAHTTTSNPANDPACPAWDRDVGSGGSSAVTFNAAGPVSCQYYCRIHAMPNTGDMRATITIQ